MDFVPSHIGAVVLIQFLEERDDNLGMRLVIIDNGRAAFAAIVDDDEVPSQLQCLHKVPSIGLRGPRVHALLVAERAARTLSDGVETQLKRMAKWASGRV